MHLHLVVSRLHRYYAELPGSFSIFLVFFFHFSDHLTQNQKTHLTVKKEKGDGLISKLITSTCRLLRPFEEKWVLPVAEVILDVEMWTVLPVTLSVDQ